MPAEIEREVERDVAGDVGRSIGTAQPPRKVQSCDVYRTGAVPPGHRRAEREGAGDCSAGRIESERRREPRQRARQLRIERRVDRDVAKAVKNTGPLLKSKTLGVDREIERGGRLTATDRPRDRKRRRRRPDQEVVKDERAGAALEGAGELVHRQVRIVSSP